jgi:nucleotide-binding universal stress UspA family protein
MFEIRRILVPTDLSKESKLALPYAISLARIFGAKLTLLHVYQEPNSVDYLRGPHACGAIIRHRREVEDELAALAAQVRENQVACNADFRCGCSYFATSSS